MQEQQRPELSPWYGCDHTTHHQDLYPYDETIMAQTQMSLEFIVHDQAMHPQEIVHPQYAKRRGLGIADGSLIVHGSKGSIKVGQLATNDEHCKTTM